MGWLQRYLNSFEGEPVWLIVLVTLLIIAAAIFVFQRLVRFSAWILAFALVATGFLVGVYFAFFW